MLARSLALDLRDGSDARIVSGARHFELLADYSLGRFAILTHANFDGSCIKTTII